VRRLRYKTSERALQSKLPKRKKKKEKKRRAGKQNSEQITQGMYKKRREDESRELVTRDNLHVAAVARGHTLLFSIMRCFKLLCQEKFRVFDLKLQMQSTLYSNLYNNKGLLTIKSQKF
jgi:hypothetical protein